MKRCKEEFERKYPLPSGVVYINGNYVCVVPQARKAAKEVNRRYDVFRNGWKLSDKSLDIRLDEQFVIRQYNREEGPVLKGHGFDGLRIGDDRAEAQDFADYLNSLFLEIKQRDEKIEQLEENLMHAQSAADDGAAK